MTNDKKEKKDTKLPPEEFGYSFAISPDDMDLTDENNNVKNKSTNTKKNEKQHPPTS